MRRKNRQSKKTVVTISGDQMEKQAVEEDVDPSLDIISELPVPILHDILCFLSHKEAVRTGVLSKSWLNIGLTRPKFDFRQRDFGWNWRLFINVIDKTINTYLNQKISVQDFRLKMSGPRMLERHLEKSGMSLSLLVVSALHHLDVKSFELSFSDLCSSRVELPRKFFTAESLEKLSLRNCILNKGHVKDVIPKNLKSLSLDGVCIEDETLELLLSTWHSIQDLVIVHCHSRTNAVYMYGYKEYQLSSQYIKHLRIVRMNAFGKGNHLFPLLESLYMNEVFLSSKSLDCLSIHFPSIQKVTLINCYDLEEYQLSSRSIKHLRIECTTRPKKVAITIDAPNLVEFEYEGGIPKSVSFEETPVKLKSKLVVRSDVNIKYDASSWCLELYESLKGLAGSQIFMDIIIVHANQNKKHVKACSPSLVAARDTSEPIVVERLTMKLTGHLSTSSSVFINNMFWIWHPRNMAQWMYNSPQDIRAKEHNYISEYLRKVLLSKRVIKQYYLWKRDLEEVSMERVFENEERDKVRFRLKWKE